MAKGLFTQEEQDQNHPAGCRVGVRPHFARHVFGRSGEVGRRGIIQDEVDRFRAVRKSLPDTLRQLVRSKVITVAERG